MKPKRNSLDAGSTYVYDVWNLHFNWQFAVCIIKPDNLTRISKKFVIPEQNNHQL